MIRFSKAIVTKYIGPTNHRGSRVKASDDNGNSVTLTWDSELDAEDNHIQAARALLAKVYPAQKHNDAETSHMVLDSIASLDKGYVLTASWRVLTNASKVKGGGQ